MKMTEEGVAERESTERLADRERGMLRDRDKDRDRDRHRDRDRDRHRHRHRRTDIAAHKEQLEAARPQAVWQVLGDGVTKHR